MHVDVGVHKSCALVKSVNTIITGMLISPSQVHFAEKLEDVRVMVVWQHASREARRSSWQRLYLDDLRFKRTISCLQDIINPVLNSQHRSIVFDERFQETF